MSKKLCQIVAVDSGLRTETTRVLTALHRATSTATLFDGFTRTYEPVDDEA